MRSRRTQQLDSLGSPTLGGPELEPVGRARAADSRAERARRRAIAVRYH
jgi:hypothetical protein